MITTVRADLGASRGEIGAAIGAWALLYVVTAPPAGRIVDRVGVERSLTVGSLLVAVSAFVQGLAGDLVALWLAVAILGVGGPLVSLAAPKLVAVWFGDARERAWAVGFFTTAPALGGVAALVLTDALLLPWLGDWRRVLAIHALLNLAACAGWIAVARKAPAPPAPGGPVASARGGVADARALLRSRGVRLAMTLGVGTFFITQGLAAWLPNMLETHTGLSTGAAANWSAASLAVGIAARLLLPGLASPERRSPLLHGVMASLALAMVAMALGPPVVDVLAVLVLGLRSTLNALVIVVLMEADLVTAANAGLAYGVWFSTVEVGGALGPMTIGAVGDSSAGFAGALVGMAAMLVVMMTVLALADRAARAGHVVEPVDAAP
jgi:CP family cyanate transporter-like MFS transporter